MWWEIRHTPTEELRDLIKDNEVFNDLIYDADGNYLLPSPLVPHIPYYYKLELRELKRRRMK
jgi:hypothetical protein